ncbi:MAG: right-handed parallel beta-helix repeat-containing protein [Planctomycetaceae bacterium]|nr:right-handed parallel beta-helix repeat-containing protein [Planctomycetaceae bacterium]
MSATLSGQTVFYVAPQGRDDNPGTADKPFATLQRARAAVQQAKAAGNFTGATVYLADGVYPQGQSFDLTAADSGAKDAPVRYCAAHGRAARLIGGIAVPASAFKPVADAADRARLHRTAAARILVADLAALGVKDLPAWPDKSHNGAGMPEVFFNGKPMPVARWPNQGWVTIAKVLDGGLKKTGKEPAAAKGGTFQYSDERPARWNIEAGVWLTGYWCHDWSDETIRVKSIDSGKKTITLAAPHHYGVGGQGKRRYFALNLLEELDVPGEWYLDAKAARLYFYPPADLAGGEVVLSLLDEPLVRIRGASHVSIEGLTLEACRGEAISVEGGAGVRVAQCLIRNTGGRGAAISGGQDNGVWACEIMNTGLSGISINGGDRATLAPAGNWATDNHIHHFSRLQRTYAPGVALNGVGNRVAHNLFHDAPHCAVLFGGNENVIEFNEFHSVCQETGDVGVIYTGRDWTVRGNVIRHNFIHDVTGPGVLGASGVYLDDCASGTIVYGNVLYKVQRGLLIGGGRDNVVENNLIVDCPRSISFDDRGLGWMKHHVSGIMTQRLGAMPYQTPPWSTKYPQLLKLAADEPGAPKGNVLRHNVIAHSPKMELAAAVTRYGTVKDNLTTDASPEFVNAQKLDLRLKPTAVLFKKLPAFKAIPFEQIGPHKQDH